MIVNAHVHYGQPWGPDVHLPVQYTAEGLLKDLDRDGVDMAVIMPFIFNYDIEAIAKDAREHSDRFIAFAMINPWRHKNRKDDINRWVDLGIKGIKLRPPSEGFNINDDLILGEIYEACIENDLPLMFHTGDDVSATPLQAEEMLQKYPDVTIILAHSGFRTLADEAIRVAKRNKQIILDQTAATSRQLHDALEEVGPDRMVMGSDSPYMDERVEIEKCRVGIKDNRARELVMGETILNVLKIKH